MLIHTSVHLLLLYLLPGMAALLAAPYIQTPPPLNIQLKSYVFEAICE